MENDKLDEEVWKALSDKEVECLRQEQLNGVVWQCRLISQIGDKYETISKWSDMTLSSPVFDNYEYRRKPREISWIEYKQGLYHGLMYAGFLCGCRELSEKLLEKFEGREKDQLYSVIKSLGINV